MDSAGITGRIFDRLATHYGQAAVFIDIDNIPFGVDFRKHIQEQLDDTDIMLAIVGPRWLGEQSERVRIKELNDPVRIEIETALNRGILVIPVLVDRAMMPSPEALPETIRDFAYRNAAEVDSGRDFNVHMTRLISAIDKVLSAKQAMPVTSPVIRVTKKSGMRKGTVKWFNPTKGYGFIEPEDGEKMVFVHISAVERAGFSTLNEGQVIEYELVTNRGKTSAENLRIT